MKRNHTAPDLSHESALWRAKYNHVCGIDEAGRGCWAGPVFAAVVIFSPDNRPTNLLGNIRDSKQMTAKQRQKWADLIKEACIDWGVGNASSQEIDTLGIVPSTRLAIVRALDLLKSPPDYLLLDYLRFDNVSIPQHALVRGDQQVLSIAAASVLAKTSRDDFMIHMENLYPGYSFRTNKGYGTAAHQQALKLIGVCPIHRLSFKPMLAIKKRPRRDV